MLQDDSSYLARIDHYYIPSLAHLLALILYTPDILFKEQPDLLVIDNISTPIIRECSTENSDTSNSSPNANVERRLRYIGELGMGLRKLAASHRIAVNDSIEMDRMALMKIFR